MIATKELERCLYLINYWNHTDEAVIEQVLNEDTQIINDFVLPFKKELNLNLLKRSASEAKIDLLKYYIFEFHDLEGCFNSYKEIFLSNSFRNYTPVLYEIENSEGIKRKLNKYENYVINILEIRNFLFDEIQLCCIKYNIDFFKLCHEISFSTEYLDCGITMVYEEQQQKNNLQNVFYDQKNELKIQQQSNSNTLPPLTESVIIHYGCSDFKSDVHTIFWIGAISHKPEKKYFFENKGEIQIIEKLKEYIEENQNKTFIHWSMNTPTFGFKAIADRYFELTQNHINIEPKYKIDLSEYLKNKYGTDYISRENGRLNNLAILNNFTGFKSDVEVIKNYDATNRLELIFSIVQAEIQGNLKLNSTFPPPPIIEQKNTKYSANEYALAYIFDLWANNKQVPINRTEGSFSAKQIKDDVSRFPNFDKAPDSFYRAVKKVLTFDLNKPNDLLNISNDWLNAVCYLSPNWKTTEQYLKDKNLIREK
jgi:hypothetical protein